MWRIAHLLESGDIAAVDDEVEACRGLASKLRQPYNLWQVATIDATLALLEGRFSEVEQLSQDALAIGQEAENRNAVALSGVQILALRREEGRLAELEPGMAAFVEQYPGIPGWRAGLAYLHSELGNVAGCAGAVRAPGRIEFHGPPARHVLAQEHDAGWRDLRISW